MVDATVFVGEPIQVSWYPNASCPISLAKSPSGKAANAATVSKQQANCNVQSRPALRFSTGRARGGQRIDALYFMLLAVVGNLSVCKELRRRGVSPAPAALSWANPMTVRFSRPESQVWVARANVGRLSDQLTLRNRPIEEIDWLRSTVPVGPVDGATYLRLGAGMAAPRNSMRSLMLC